MGQYQDPRASKGHLISNFSQDGTLSAVTFLQMTISMSSLITLMKYVCFKHGRISIVFYLNKCTIKEYGSILILVSDFSCETQGT